MTSSEPQPAQPTFEQALAELETIVAELEEGQTPLADSLARYERGVKTLARVLPVAGERGAQDRIVKPRRF